LGLIIAKLSILIAKIRWMGGGKVSGLICITDAKKPLDVSLLWFRLCKKISTLTCIFKILEKFTQIQPRHSLLEEFKLENLN